MHMEVRVSGNVTLILINMLKPTLHSISRRKSLRSFYYAG